MQLRDFLAAQLVPLAALEPFQQPADASGQLERVEGLRRSSAEPTFCLVSRCYSPVLSRTVSGRRDD
jgi:hypothetical protein